MELETDEDDQLTQRDTGSALDHASRELCRLLLDMEVERRAMVSAVEATDLVNIETRASDLVCVFQAGQRAIRVIARSVAKAQDLEQRERAALHRQHSKLDELFRYALERTVGTATHDLLTKLHAELRLVDEEPADKEGHAQPTSIRPVPENASTI